MELFIDSGEKQTLLVLSSSALYWDKASTTTADVVLVSWIPPIPCSYEQLQAVSCCCFWSFPLLLHETGMLASSAAAQPALTSSPGKKGTGDPSVLSRGAEQGTAVLQQCRAALGGWHLAVGTTAKEAAFFSPVRTQRNSFSK